MKGFLGVAAAAAIGLAASAFAATAGETVNYKVGGNDFEGYFAKAEGKSKGLVVIIHDWDGLTGYEQKRADMLAKQGYDAFAIDLFGKGNRPETVPKRRAETGKLYKDRELMRARLMAGYEAARQKAQGKAVVIGYCFGGAAALEMARANKAQNVAGYVTFHGGLSTPKGQNYSKATPPILVAHGGADTAVKMSDVATLADELEKAGVKYEMQVYSGAPHAFTVFGSNRYREDADKKSWEAFNDFLKAQLGS